MMMTLLPLWRTTNTSGGWYSNAMSETWVVRDQFMADMFCKFVQETIKAEKVQRTSRRTCTSRQNRAMYAAFTRLATALNESGHMLKHPFADDLGCLV